MMLLSFGVKSSPSPIDYDVTPMAYDKLNRRRNRASSITEYR